MLRKLVAIFVLLPLAVVIVVFAMANRESVVVSLDPFGAANPAFSIRLPLFILIFALVILGVVVGGIAAWLRQGRWRRLARKREADVAALRREVELLNGRIEHQNTRPNAASEIVRLPYRSPAA